MALIFTSYAVWLWLAIYGHQLSPAFWIILSAVNVTLFMSITHEVLHGHPTRHEQINRLLILFPIGWSLPYERFRDTHLNHHDTGELTDPFDDPESWYLDKKTWIANKKLTNSILLFNNMLLGRMLIGPIIGLGSFYKQEICTVISSPEHRGYLVRTWLFHGGLCLLLATFISIQSFVPFWQWALSIYLGHSILLVRTYLEHQAAPDHGERTVIIEKACPIALLFLFNNYHFIHHDRPGIPWYRLPGEFRDNSTAYIERNGSYVYKSYFQVFRKYLFTAKEPVLHPFLRNE